MSVYNGSSELFPAAATVADVVVRVGAGPFSEKSRGLVFTKFGKRGNLGGRIFFVRFFFRRFFFL